MSKHTSADQILKDNYNFVYLTFLLYGVGVLQPFNVVMACLDFYDVTMPGYQCANIWPFVINGPLWFTQVYLAIYGGKITYSTRLIPGFAILSACMVIIPVLTNMGGSTGFYATDAVLVFFGFASGAC